MRSGCLLLGLVPTAALLLAASYAATTEAESPASFPGLRDDHADIASAVLVLGVLALAGALWVLARALPRAAGAPRVALACVTLLCGLLVAVAAHRVWTLGPQLECAGGTGVARQLDGSYVCFDR